MADRLYDRLAPTLLMALALLGGYRHQGSLVVLPTTILIILLITRSWSRHSLDAVGYEREASDDRAFPGDELLLTLRFSNRKLLPLPWLEIDDQVPHQLFLSLANGERDTATAKGMLKLVGSVVWHQRVQWRYRLRCRRRGIFSLGPATIRSGDPFGLFPRSATSHKTERIVVYPSLLPLEQLRLPAGFPLGERKPERWIFEDPSRVAGVRDYRREDPFNHIHWKATARRQQLQVKLHEPTTTLETAIFLGVDTFGNGDAESQRPGDAENVGFEYAVSVVATLAHRLIGQRHPVGLYINGGTPGPGDPVQLPPGGSQEQLIQILELLAGVEPVSNGPIERILGQVVPSLPWGSSTVLVVARISEPLAAVLDALRQTGRKAEVLCVGKETASAEPGGVTVHRLDPLLKEREIP